MAGAHKKAARTAVDGRDKEGRSHDEDGHFGGFGLSPSKVIGSLPHIHPGQPQFETDYVWPQSILLALQWRCQIHGALFSVARCQYVKADSLDE